MKKVFLLLVVIVLGMSPASAFAAPSNPGSQFSPQITDQPSVSFEPYGRTCRGMMGINTHVCRPGKTKIICRGDGFMPGHVVTVYLDGKPMGSTTADSRGRATFKFTIPAGTPRGLHTITMQGDSGRPFCGTLVLMNKVYCFNRPVGGFSRSDVSGQDFEKKQAENQSAISMGMLVPLLTALAVILTTAGVGIKLLKK